MGPSSLGSGSVPGASGAPSSAGLDDLLGGSFSTGPSSMGSAAPVMSMGMPANPLPAVSSGGGGIDDLFSLGATAPPTGFNFYSPPKQEWLDAAKNKVVSEALNVSVVIMF